ncbi:Increased DNA methylation 1 [Linum grandiflorum]
MSSGSGKKTTTNHRRRFKQLIHLHDKVEVRSEDKGFEGSWHQGTVTGRIRIGFSEKFDVEYDYFFDDDDNHYVDVVTVSRMASGIRGYIRPVPPEIRVNEYMLPFGLCVDVNCNDGWWEGVVFDYEDGSNQRKVFFPDIGDEKVAPVCEIRVTQDWDEVSGEWNRRGTWLFLELVDEYRRKGHQLPVSIKQLWYDLRVKEGFVQTIGGDWTCSSRAVWEELVLDAIRGNLMLVSDRLLHEVSAKKLLEFAKSFNLVTDADINMENSDTSLDARSDSELPQPLPIENSTPEGDDEVCALVTSSLSSGFDARSDSELPQPLLIENSTPEGDDEVRALAISSLSSETVVSTSSAMEIETSSLQRKQKYSWIPAGPDMVQEPKYCPEAVVKYLQGNSKDTVAKVCKVLVKSEDKNNPSPSPSRSPSPSPSRSSYDCPQAIVECYKVSCTGGASKYSDVIKRARDELVAMGWNIEEKVSGNGKRVKVYKSPGGRSFVSLRLACQSVMNESDTSVASKPSKRITQPKHLRSSKRARQTVKLASKHPLTVVSWLIDNNAILPREKVYCRKSKDGDLILKGRITPEGINCFCCTKVFSLSSFELHVGSKHYRNYHRGPTSSLFLADGRSLSDCQVQVMRHGKETSLKSKKPPKRTKARHEPENDDVCSVCQYGGDLILCDLCPSSFHGGCLGMQDVPSGDWFCPSCCCRICKRTQVSKDRESVLRCTQCEYSYHISCLKKNGVRKTDFGRKEGNWFCGKNCKRIFDDLSANLRIPIPAGVDGLTWTLHKSVSESDARTESGVASDIEAEAQSYMKLGIALHVIHECFEPLEESSTGRDVVSDVIFSRSSKTRRLDFRGFYTALLEKDDEVISVATIRIFGDNVAEVPLVATRHQYRQRGMCRVLMNMLEKKLTELGVERLVLPAIPSMFNTWTGSFGFSEVTDSDKLGFADCIFLNFPGTTMCHKLLTATNESSPLQKEILSLPFHSNSGNGEEMELELDSSPSPESEVVQTEKTGLSSSKAVIVRPEPRQPDCSSGSSRLTPRKRSCSGDSGLLKYHRKVKRKMLVTCYNGGDVGLAEDSNLLV